MNKCLLLLVCTLLCAGALYAQQVSEPQYQRTESNGVRVYQSAGYVNQETTVSQPVQETTDRPQRSIEEYSLDEVNDGLTFTNLKLEDARQANDQENIRIYEAEIARLNRRKEQLTAK